MLPIFVFCVTEAAALRFVGILAAFPRGVWAECVAANID